MEEEIIEPAPEVEEPVIEPLLKPRKERSPAQILALEKGRQVNKERREQAKKLKEEAKPAVVEEQKEEPVVEETKEEPVVEEKKKRKPRQKKSDVNVEGEMKPIKPRKPFLAEKTMPKTPLPLAPRPEPVYGIRPPNKRGFLFLNDLK